MGADPAHVFTQQTASRDAKLVEFERLHAKGLHYAIARGGFLQNLTELAKPRLAGVRRATNAFPQARYGKNNQRNQREGSQGQLPVKLQQHEEKEQQGEGLAEKVGQPLTPAQTKALDTLDEVLKRRDLMAEFSLEPGDMYFINNRWILHNRTAFEDWPELERRRHLVRLWLQR